MDNNYFFENDLEYGVALTREEYDEIMDYGSQLEVLWKNIFTEAKYLKMQMS